VEEAEGAKEAEEANAVGKLRLRCSCVKKELGVFRGEAQRKLNRVLSPG